MTVVSNTSPISYLVLIDQIDLLPRIFTTLIIPTTVRDELIDPKAPIAVQQWIANPPNWLSIQSISTPPDPELLTLDAGECSAILLAETLSARLILLDDLAARHIAARRKLPLIGSLGILDLAASNGWIDFADAISRLRSTNFRSSTRLIEQLLQKHQLK